MWLSVDRYVVATGVLREILKSVESRSEVSTRLSVLRQRLGNRLLPQRLTKRLAAQVKDYEQKLKELEDIRELLHDRLGHLIDIELAQRDLQTAELLVAISQHRMLQTRLAWCAGASMGLRYYTHDCLRKGAPIDFERLNRNICALQTTSACCVALIESLFQAPALIGWSHDFKPSAPSLLLGAVCTEEQIEEVQTALANYEQTASQSVEALLTIGRQLTLPYDTQRQNLWNTLLDVM